MRHAFNPPGTDMQVVADQAYRHCFDDRFPESTLVHDHKEADSCDQRPHQLYLEAQGLVDTTQEAGAWALAAEVMKYNKMWEENNEVQSSTSVLSKHESGDALQARDGADDGKGSEPKT